MGIKVKRKFPNVHAQIWIVGKDGKLSGHGTKRHEIYLLGEDIGIVINDGREVHKIDDKWIYRPR